MLEQLRGDFRALPDLLTSRFRARQPRRLRSPPRARSLAAVGAAEELPTGRTSSACSRRPRYSAPRWSGLTLETTSAGGDRACRPQAVGAELRPGDVVLIAGDVGTGKTTFVRAACRAPGRDGPRHEPVVHDRAAVRGPRSGVARRPLPAREPDRRGPRRCCGLPHAGSGRLRRVARRGAVAEVEPQRVVLELRLSHMGGDRRRIEADGEARLVDAMRASSSRDADRVRHLDGRDGRVRDPAVGRAGPHAPARPGSGCSARPRTRPSCCRRSPSCSSRAGRVGTR